MKRKPSRIFRISRAIDRDLAFGGLAIAVTIVAAAGALYSLFGAGSAYSAREQPIQFNHRTHVDIEDCETCHRFVRTRKVAGRPEIETCMECHDEAQTDSAEEEKVRTYAEEGRPLRWVRLYRVPRHVRFSHQRHVVVGRVSCETCHGNIAETTKPPAEALVDIDMDFCISCHREQAVMVTARTLESLARMNTPQAVMERVGRLAERRFASKGDFLAALEGQEGEEITQMQKRLVVDNLAAGPQVTTDCIACHR